MDALTQLLDRQSGVVARRQLLDPHLGLDLTPNDLRRMLRRRELVVAGPAGVYAGHTGELTWAQQAWVGVLAAWPAALCHRSAIRAANGPGLRIGGAPLLHVAVDRTRTLDAPPGVRLHRLADLDAKTLWNCSPPRVRIEHAAIDVAAETRGDMEAIAVLADAVQARLTTASRLREALASRTRIAQRAFLEQVLTDIAEGSCSALEHGYLTRVERAHGLPAARRQFLASARGPIYRDVDYRDYRLIVELDGRLFHDNARARAADLDRDLDAAVTGRATVRLGWGQTFEHSCRTAWRIGALLQQRGWQGVVRPCPECP